MLIVRFASYSKEKRQMMAQKSEKIIILDGQIFQTDAWDRGMGKYMLQLMKQLSEQASSDTKLKLLFNSQIETNPARYETIKYLCPNFEQVFTSLPYAKDKHATTKQYKKALNRFIEDTVSSSAQLTYMITTLFSFDIFAEYPDRTDNKALIFYDLTPLFNWKDLGGYFPPHLYMTRFNRIYESDIIYCISETTRQDVLKTFCVDPRKAVNINGGFTEHHLDAVKPSSFKVPKKYILFPTGNLPHKNNEVIFRAMGEVMKQVNDVHLLVTSKFSDVAKEKLLKIHKKNVIFTQNVSDEELQYLYKRASIVVFASKYEGLGLPVLDAVFHQKPIVASSISVFKEMSDDAFFFFDVDDAHAASAAIVQALKGGNFEKKVAHYPSVMHKYDWKVVGRTVLSHLSNPRSLLSTLAKSQKSIQKIAIVSPNPGVEKSVGRLSEQVYACLRDEVSVSYFFDSFGLKHSDMERPTFLDHIGVEAYDLSRLSMGEYRKYDKVIYLIDNQAMDFMIMKYIVSLPGYLLCDSNINKESVMYRAASAGILSKMEFDSNDMAYLDKIANYILNDTKKHKKAQKAEKVVRGFMPKRMKLEYLKKELKADNYDEAK